MNQWLCLRTLAQSLRLATALPVRPVLRIGGGKLGLSGVFRRGGDPVAALLRHATSDIEPGKKYRFAIAHAGLPGQAADLRAAVAALVEGTAEIPARSN